jgi:soluble lytic murein transglycosylase-like protein
MSILRYGKKILAQGGVLMGGGKGGGGGGGQTAQQNQYTSLSPWAQPYITSLLGAAQQQVFDTKQTPAQAGTPAQYDQYGNQISAGTSGTPAGTEITGIHPYNAFGAYNPQGGQYGMTASDVAAANASVAGFNPLQQQAFQGAANLQLPNQFGPATGAALQGTGQALMAGQNYAQQATNPYAVGAYMNPYLQQSLQPQLNMIAQQGGIQGAQQQGAATQAGAFGGSRNALQQALTQQNTLMAQQQAIGQGYNQAFQQAQQAQQYGAGLGLQGAQAGIQGAGQLGSLGGQQLAAQQGTLGLQNQYGGQQQQQAQNIINAGMTNYQTAMQYPMTQLQQLKGLVTGIPVSDVTTTQQQAQPSAATQLAGLGTAGVAGLALASKAEGGVIKSYAGGGIAALNRKALLEPESIPQKSLKDGILNPQVSGIAQAIQLADRVQGKNADALSKPPVQGTVVGDLEAKASQMDQAEMIPKAMAVLKQKMDQAIEEGDMPLAKKYAAELQQLAEIAQGQQAPAEVPSAPAPQGIDAAAQQAQVAQAQPEQGIEAASSNLPTQAMAEGGIVGYASGGVSKMLQDADEEERLAADEAELYGSGTDNDFIQSIMPAAKQSGTAHPSAAISVKFEPKEAGIEALKSHKYASLVAEEAKRQGRDPNVLLEMLQKESGGLKNPETARSKAGAIGIAQFMPKTAKQYGINPEIPEEAAYGMVKHFGYLEDKYGDPKLAMAAYNWGEGNLNKWLKSGADRSKLPQETRQYARLAEGGIAHYDEGDLVKEDPEAVRQAYIDAALLESKNKPNRVSQADVRAAESRIAALNNLAPAAPAAAPVSSTVTPTPVPVKPIDTAERDRERNRATSTAGVNKEYIETLNAAQNTGSQSNAPANVPASTELNGLDALQAEILQDIKDRKAEAKKSREQNNLLALMQAGLGVAASKNIHPLGAVGEGGMQGLGALAQLRKQEGEEAKDIAAQQIGAYRFGTTAANTKVLQEIKQAQQDLRKTPEERARDMAETEYTRQVASIDKRQAELEKQYGGVLDVNLQEQIDNQRRALRKQIYDHFKVPVQTEFKLPPIVLPTPPKKPGLWDRITGKDDNTPQGNIPEPPPGYKVQ